MILRVFKKNIFCVILVGDLSGLLAAELALGVVGTAVEVEFINRKRPSSMLPNGAPDGLIKIRAILNKTL